MSYSGNPGGYPPPGTPDPNNPLGYPQQPEPGYPDAPQQPDLGYPDAPQQPQVYPTAPQQPVSGYPTAPQQPMGYPTAPQDPNTMGAGTPTMPPPGDINLGAMGPGGAPKKRRSPLVMSIIGLVALLVVGGVAWGAVAYFNTEGTDTEESLPASTKAFVSFNLDVSKNEQLKLADVASKFPALTQENDPQNMVSDQLKKIEDDDSSLDGKPSEWVGLSGSMALWTDNNSNPYLLMSIASRDDAKAKADLKEAQRNHGKDKMGFVVSDGNVMIAAGSSHSQAAAKSAASEAKSKPLAESDNYSDAADWLGKDQVVTAWADLKPAWAAVKKLAKDSNSPVGSDGDAMFSRMLDSYDTKMNGQLALGATATDYGIEVKSHTFGAKGTSKGSSDLASTFTDLPKSDLAGAVAFPDDMGSDSMVGALMSGGLASTGGYAGDPTSDPSGEIQKIYDALAGGTGTVTANGFPDDPAMEASVETTSADKASTLASLGDASGGAVQTKTEGNKVTLDTPGYAPGGGKMSDAANVKVALQDAPKDLNFVFYADLSKMIPSDETDLKAMKGLSVVQGTEDNESVGYYRMFIG